MKKAIKISLIAIAILIAIPLVVFISVTVLKLCPPQGPWPMPPWCEGAPSPTEVPGEEEGDRISMRGMCLQKIETTSRVAKVLKGAGVNWVQLNLWVLVTDEGELIDSYDEPPYDGTQIDMDKVLEYSRKTEQIMVNAINWAHRNGFKVFLITYHARLGAHHEYGRGLKADVDEMLSQAKEIALKWAKIAEENQVELFAPRKELQMFVGWEKTLEWDAELLPELRKVTNKTELVCGAFELYRWDRHEKRALLLDRLPPDLDLSGWDYLGVDFYGSGVDTFDELRSVFARFVLKSQELKEKNGLKGIVFEELGEPHAGTEAFLRDETLSQDDIVENILKAYVEVGGEAIDGFFPWIHHLWTEGAHFGTLRPSPSKLREIVRQIYTSPISPTLGEVTPAEEYVPTPLAYNVTETLLKEDFDSGTTNLTLHRAYLANGVLEIHGDAGCEALPTENWTNYVFKGRFKILNGTLGLWVRTSDSGMYHISVDPISDMGLVRHNSNPFKDGEVKEVIDILDSRTLIEYDKWYAFAIVVKDGTIQVYIDDKLIFGYHETNPLIRGGILIDAKGDVLVDNLFVGKIL